MRPIALFPISIIGTPSVIFRNLAGTAVSSGSRINRRTQIHLQNDDFGEILRHDDIMASNKKRKSSSSSAARKKAAASKTKASYGMRMILSPAKTLNLDRDASDLPVAWTEPLANLSDQRSRVVTAVKERAASASKLGSLLHTSAKITAAAQSYWKEISGDAASGGGELPAKPCIMTFDGAAYAGLNVRDSISADGSRLQYLQDHLRIVDPLYGWLRPMDAIEPYRLEMASKGVFTDDPKLKLENYWKVGIASCLETEEQESTKEPIVVVNLASDEYSAAVDRAMVKVVFRHGGRTIAVHAKRARGLMVRYATLNDIHSVDDLMGFDLEGYTYRADESTYEPGAVESTLLAPAEVKEEEDNGKKTKQKKKKREKPLTLVFDRPGTWKKS